MFKKHYKKVFQHIFKKPKIEKKIHFEVLLSGPSRCCYLGQVDCNLKMANLAQIITPQICVRNFFRKPKVLKPLFYSVFEKQCFVKSKLGPDNNTTACIYIYIYAAGCLIEPPFSTLFARNLRKRSAKMNFLIKKWPREKCTPGGFN